MFIAVKRFIHLYPLQTALLCFSLALVNLMEGLGLGLVVPVFQKLLQTSGAPSRLTVMLDRLFASLHLSATLENILLLLCTVFFLRAFATLWARHLSVKISSDFQLNLKNRLYRRLLDAGISFFMVQRQGDLTNVLTVEANRAANAFFSAAQWISTLLAALLYIGVAVFISGWLAFFAGITGIVVLLPLKRIVRRAVFYGNRLTELNENIQNELIEIFGGIKVVKAAAHENQTFQRFSRHNKDYRDAWYRLVFNANSIPIYAQPIAVTLLSVLLYISVQIHIHVAEMMVFLLAFMRLVPSLSLLQTCQHDLNNNLPGYERALVLSEQATAMEERKGGIPVNGLEKQLVFENVTFGYHTDKPVLKQIDLVIPSRKSVAFVGPSGAGKSTLIDLILGFFSPQQGTIWIDDIGLDQVNLKTWRQQIAYVAQEVVLFNDTVKENIRWESKTAEENDIAAAAKIAAAHEFIVHLENSYDTQIGDRGVRLSGGQRQRLALARAILKKPSVLILDEATSELDHQSEMAIKKSIAELRARQQMTIIMIAHRLTTVQEADHIFVLKNGKIIEQGNWEQLSRNQRSYIYEALQDQGA